MQRSYIFRREVDENCCLPDCSWPLKMGLIGFPRNLGKKRAFRNVGRFRT